MSSLTAGTLYATHSATPATRDIKSKSNEMVHQHRILGERLSASKQNKALSADSGTEYLMLGKSMFDDEGANVYPSGGAPVSYPVYFDFDDEAGIVRVSNLFRNYLDEEAAPAVLNWDKEAAKITANTPEEFYSPDECVKFGEQDGMIVGLQAGNPYGIGYWSSEWEFVMNQSKDGNVIVPQSGFAMVGYIYDDFFECYYNDGVYYDVIYDARFFKRSEGVAIYADTDVIDFGETFVNTSTHGMFKVVNAGSEEADFVISSNSDAYKVSVTSGFIAPGEYVDIEVTFSPSVTGTIEGMITIDTEESSATIPVIGISRESLDYSPIVSAGYEYMNFSTGNEYPFVIDTQLTGFPVAVSTNADNGRTSSWLEVEIEVPEGKRGILNWKGFFNPRWSVYDSFTVTDNDKIVYETPSDDQYVMDMQSEIGLIPGSHVLKFTYEKGTQVNPIDVVLGEDYAYISDLNLTFTDYLENLASVSIDSYDFGTVYKPADEAGLVTRGDVATIRNNGYGVLEIKEIESDDCFNAIVSPVKIQPEKEGSISLSAFVKDLGSACGKVVIKTSAGDFTIDCKINVEQIPDYQEIVAKGDFTFEVGANPFKVVDGRAINDNTLPNDGTSTISEFTALFNIPRGKAGLLTWTGDVDCGDGDHGLIMIDGDAYGMGEYEGVGDAGCYTMRPYQCWLESGNHMISFGYEQCGTSEWDGAGTMAIGDLSLEIVDQIPTLVFWEETPVEFKPLYPGKSDSRIVRIYNMGEATMALESVEAPDNFSVRYSLENNSQVPQYVAAGFDLAFSPKEIGSHSGNVIVKTSVGNIEIPVIGTCMDPADIIYEEDFENGLDGWTIIDANGDDRTWTQGGSSFAYTGSDCLMFNSFFTRIDSEDYIISPEFAIPSVGATLTYFRTYSQPGVRQTYEVKVGVGDDPADYATVFKDEGINFGGDYDQIKISLGEFSGETVRICFANITPTGDKNVLAIDDIVVLKGDVSSVEDPISSMVVKREFISLSGMKVKKPSDGIYMMREFREDGSVTTKKVWIK